MATDAACGWILDELEDGNNYPAASSHDDITAPNGSFVNLLVLDMEHYSELIGT